MTSQRLRVVVCEDEPLAREHLRTLLAAHPTLEIVAEAADGDAALAAIDAERPDLVFLDIQMPGRSGLRVLDEARHRPAVIFTTAYDRHAIAAFELGAVDYLLKPFGAARLAQAVARVTERLPAAESTDAPLTHLFVRDRGRLIPVNLAEVTRIEAEDDFVALHLRGRRLLHHATLSATVAQLDPRQWIRVHRSHAINLAFVSALEPLDANRLLVRLGDGSVVRASRSGTQALRALILQR